MIDVTTYSQTGAPIDSAEAETPEDAVYAARTLLREAVVRSSIPDPTVSFAVDGSPVRVGLRFHDLTDWDAAAARSSA